MNSSMDRIPFEFEKKDFWEYYCPICKIQRRSLYFPSPRTKHYIQLAVLICFSTFCVAPWMGLKAIGFFLPLWPLFEFFYRARARQALICDRCGFDPYLFKFDVKLAKERVEKFYAEKEAKALKGTTKPPETTSSKSAQVS